MRATGRYPSADVEIPAEQERGEDGNQAECNHNHFIISLPTRLGAREAIIILIPGFCPLIPIAVSALAEKMILVEVKDVGRRCIRPSPT